MVKLLLMSLIIANVAIPGYFANMRQPKLAFKRTVWSMVAFNFVYLIILIFIYPRIES